MSGPVIRPKQIPSADEKKGMENAVPPVSATNPFVTSNDPRLSGVGSGIKGDTGVEGAKGDTGTHGDTGVGLQGDTGPSGLKGDTGSGGSAVAALDDLTDVTAPSPSKDQVLKFNGTEWVPAAYNATFQFGISSFSISESSPQLIGTGEWKAPGLISFTAAYTNGPATSATISKSGWSNLVLFAPYTSVVNAQGVNYPSVGASASFTLNASAGAENASSSRSIAFYNNIFWGVSSKASSFLESDVEGLASYSVSNSKGRSITVAPGVGEYIIYAFPVRLGTVVFWVGGFEGGFQAPETVSLTNSAGYTEDYYVYRSTNAALGSTTVTVV